MTLMGYVFMLSYLSDWTLDKFKEMALEDAVPLDFVVVRGLDDNHVVVTEIRNQRVTHPRVPVSILHARVELVVTVNLESHNALNFYLSLYQYRPAHV